MSATFINISKDYTASFSYFNSVKETRLHWMEIQGQDRF
jgi:hypothetical protein